MLLKTGRLMTLMGLALVLAACGAGTETPTTSTGDTGTAPPTNTAMAEPSVSPTSVATPATSPTDAAFLSNMIVHHEGAIRMAQIAQQRAEHEEIRQLADDIIAALLSIAREALTNVLRHSGAARAEVLVNIDDDRVVMAITDDGVGAIEEPGPGSFGISGMRERAASFGGELSVHAVAGLGTRVECVLPLA